MNIVSTILHKESEEAKKQMRETQESAGGMISLYLIYIDSKVLLLSDLARNVMTYYHNVVAPGTGLKNSRNASSGSYSLRDNASGSDEEDDCDDEEEQV